MQLLIDDEKILVKKANSFYQRLLGLMGQKEITYGILFPHTTSIHTFFMKANIDVIAINSNNEVIFKYENVAKNKIVTVNNSIKNTSILELPANTSKQIKIGDKLTFISE